MRAPARTTTLALGLVVAFAGSQAFALDDDRDDETLPVLFGPPPPVPPAVMSRDELGRVTIRATRLPAPLTLDGRLDERVYADVPPLTEFVQQEPLFGEPATERTEAWIFFDDRNVYVSARCWDSHPERMVVNEMRRDNFNIYQNENLTVVFDTFYDRRNGFFFQTNPLGALRDQAVGDEGEALNRDWNTVWDVKASIFDEGWIVEIAIPFKSLRYRAGRDQIWSVNLRRSIRWKNEEVFISPVGASHRFRGIYRFSEAATLVGIEAPVSSRNLELKPYGISTLVTNNQLEPVVTNDFGGDFGVDLKYGLTQSLIGDFTYNTDFAQVEADQAQVNLTRFSLFFPEQREFFLEGQSIFAFGGAETGGGGRSRPGSLNTDLTPILFFSRQIGITASGVDPILGGGRVTGRAGPYRIGALNLQTEGIDGVVDGTNFTVGRLRRDVSRRSDVGVLATHRTTSLTEGGTSNSLLGVDGNFAFYQNLRLNAYYAVTRTELEDGSTVSGDDSSYLGRLDYNADRYGLQLEHLKLGEAFKPELGFVRREAFRRSFAQARFSPRVPSIEAIRRFDFQGEVDYVEGLPSDRVETRRFQGQFQIQFSSSDEVTVEYNNQFELLPADFEIAESVVLAPGGYHFEDVRLAYNLGAQHVVPGSISFRTGGLFSGRRREIAYSGRIEVTPSFSIEPNVGFNWVDLPEGKFTTELVSTRVNYTFTARMFFSALLQYNSSASSASSNLRFRWEYEPGSDFFVVYSDGRDTSGTSFTGLLNRTFAVKLTKLLRF